MSGGSYNYLCYGEIGDHQVADLERMRDRLRELAATRDPDGSIGYEYAARRTEFVLHGLRVAWGWADFLHEPWHAVEWLDSSDWGAEQTDEAVRKWFHEDDKKGDNDGAEGPPGMADPAGAGGVSGAGRPDQPAAADLPGRSTLS
jgi:hypothetical protein